MHIYTQLRAEIGELNYKMTECLVVRDVRYRNVYRTLTSYLFSRMTVNTEQSRQR